MNIFRTSVEKPLKFLGIAFRNRDHIRYFLISSTVTTLFLTKLFLEKNHKEAIVPLFISVGTAIVATIMTGFGKRTTAIYSRDCIWWNLFLAGISLLAMLLMKYRFFQ